VNTTLVVTGAVFVAAAIAGKGLEGAGIKIPALDKGWQQFCLAVLGILVIAIGVLPQLLAKGAPGPQQAENQPTHGTSSATASSSPVASNAPTSPTGTPLPNTAPSGTYLMQRPLVVDNAFGLADGPVQIGSHTYQYSVSFDCGQAAAEVQSVTYNVGGFSHLRATIGLTNDSPPTPGHVANVFLYKNGSSTPFGPPITGMIGSGQPVDVDLQKATQLTISCYGAGGKIALGDAVLSSS
jgi:hypothetical protein